MHTLTQDLRFAVRSFRRNPGFSAAVITLLALGIGVNTAVFSVVNAVLLRSLPYRDAGQLVWVWEKNEAQGIPAMGAAPQTVADWRARSQVFADIAVVRPQGFVLTGFEPAERLAGAQVSTGLFALLGVSAAQGRVFLEPEGQPGGARVALISHGLWQRRFGASLSAVGSRILLDGVPYTLVGVMGPAFGFPQADTDVWVPWIPDAGHATQRGTKFRYLRPLARLKPGVTLARAQTEMEALARQLGEEYPATNRGWTVELMTLRDYYVNYLRPALLALLAAAVLVTLIACANVANLLLAREAGRGAEAALRAALGASRLRIARQWLTESIALSLAGGAAGLLLGMAVVRPVVAIVPTVLPRPIPGLSDVSLDYRVLGFTVALAILTGVLCGLMPALRARKPELAGSLRESSRGGGGSAQAARFRAFLVVMEIAFAVVLCVNATLMARSFARMLAFNPGFQAPKVLTARISLPAAGYPDAGRRVALFDRLLDRLRYLPGVESAGLSKYLPMGDSWGLVRFTLEGRSGGADEARAADDHVVSAGYCETMGIALRRGRLFNPRDSRESPRVALINQAAAERFWPEEDPLGRQVRLEGEPADAQPLTIVGIVANVHYFGYDVAPRPELYRLLPQAAPVSAHVVLRAGVPPASLAGGLRREVAALDPALPVYAVRRMEDIVSDSLWHTRLATLLFGIFSGLALLLAAVGIYAVTAYSVSRRRAELGLRMALGADRATVLWIVLRDGSMVIVAGLAGGLIGAWLFSRGTAGLLYGIRPDDAGTYLLVVAVLAGTAVLANLIPAVRMANIDPMSALRHE